MLYYDEETRKRKLRNVIISFVSVFFLILVVLALTKAPIYSANNNQTSPESANQPQSSTSPTIYSDSTTTSKSAPESSLTSQPASEPAPESTSTSTPAQATPVTTTTSNPQTTECLIKGNISSKGEKIYHVPGQQYYDVTKITPSKGERYFCTEEEAVAAGWRKSKV